MKLGAVKSYIKKSISTVLAFSIILSITAISGVVLNVRAADEDRTYYLNVSNNSNWNAKTDFSADFLDENEDIVATKALSKEDTSLYSVILDKKYSNVSKIKFHARDFTLPDSIESLDNNKIRIVSSDSSRKTIYLWNSSNQGLKAWPGTTMKQAGKYYYIDVDKDYTKCIFSNDGNNKTTDLSVATYDNVAFYNGARFKTTYSATVSVDSFVSMQNTLYVSKDDDSKLLISKYSYPNYDNVNMQTVCVYGENWQNKSDLYVSYDLFDPLLRTVKLTKQTTAKGIVYFKGTVPEGSMFRFQPNESNTTGATDNLTYPSGTYSESDPATYLIEDFTKWGKLSDVPEEVENRIPANFGSGVYAAKATYFDYMTDGELKNGYLNPTNDGDWYPFTNFNKAISAYAKENATWNTPLYYGNFSGNQTGEAGGLKPYNYKYPPNNSNGLSNYHQAVQGLVSDTLVNNNLMATSSLQMPSFDREFLTNTPSKYSSYGELAKVFDSYFPFATTTDSSTGVTTYSFDSSGNGSKSNSDNVYFTWDGKTPTAVNYGKGSSYAVKDGSDAFKVSGTGYGIFPFNNASSQNKGNRSGNSNIDFGFGVKLDIKFRVPDNGTIDGTEDGQPVMFNYSGDDDLWLYISEEDGSNSQLVLDLGGDHKFTSGSINLKTMQAKANDVYCTYEASKPVVVPSDSFYIKSSASKYYLWLFDGSSDSKQVEITTKDSTGNYFVVSQSDVQGYNKCLFKPNKDNWDGKSSDLTISSLYGNAYNSDGSKYNPNSSSGQKTINGSQTKTINGGKHLDASKTYRCTIFYMERGLIESNLKLSFTTTPVVNELQVDKTVSAENVNNETISNEIKNSQLFNYNVDDSTGSTSGKTYVYTDKDGKSATKTISNNSFSLKDSENANFSNSFATKSDMTFVENSNSTGVQFDPSWDLYDLKTGDKVKSGQSETSNFKLVDPTSEASNSKLKLKYTNTVQTTNLLLSKTVVGDDGATVSPLPKQDFAFKVLLDLDGGTNYKNYPLYYIKTVNGHDTKYYADAKNNYEISFSPEEKVKIVGLPVGASYKVTENETAGFTLVNPDELSGVLQKDIDAKVEASNKQSIGEGELSIGKSLDDKAYTGSNFSFKLTGLPKMTISDDEETVDMNGKSTSTNNSKDGVVTFKGGSALTFSQIGYYRYSITENASTNPDFAEDSSTYFVSLYVTENDSKKLVIDSDKTKFYKATKEQVEQKLYSEIFNSEPISEVVFKNTSQHGMVTVNKKDQSQTPLSDTTFALVKVSSVDLLSDEDISSIIKNEQEHMILATTDNDGVAKFENLVIFKDGKGEFDKSSGTLVYNDNNDDYIKDGTQKYQTYCLFEYSPKTGFNPSSVKQYFTLPTQGKYAITFDYVDGAITMPEASGAGMNMYIFIGFIVLFAGLTLFVVYILYDKTMRKKRSKRFVKN